MGKLNRDTKFDLENTFFNYFGDDPESNPYIDVTNHHIYLEKPQFISEFQNNVSPLMLSLNIQSLNSKFNNLNSFIADLNMKNIDLSLIALQETWQIQHEELFSIPGFKLFISQRTKSKGGGVGFYINSELPSKILHNLSSLDQDLKVLKNIPFIPLLKHGTNLAIYDFTAISPPLKLL